jgi:hypothetical protein
MKWDRIIQETKISEIMDSEEAIADLYVDNIESEKPRSSQNGNAPSFIPHIDTPEKISPLEASLEMNIPKNAES